MCCAIVGLAQDQFVPAQYRGGSLPPIPFQAVGGGEVVLELSVSSSGAVSSVRILRATPPFTDVLDQAARRWQFAPAEDGVGRRAVDSRVLVFGTYRPPTLNTPTLGTLPTDVAAASDQIPFPVTTVTPAYPPLALESGMVLIEALVDARGVVTDAKVISSSPAFDGPALDAARQWRFRAARIRGVAVETFAYLAFAFRQPVTSAPIQ